MNDNWETKKLGDICEIYQPKTISTKEMSEDGNYLVYGANGIIGRYHKFNHEHPQLLITCRGATCGSVNVSTPMSWITGNAMVVRPKNDSLTIKFLEYLFRGGIDVSKTITGAAQPQITRTNLAPIIVAFPKSLAEQQRIVAILDEAFAAIAQAKENAEKNLQNARELFDSYLQSVFANPGDGWEEKTLGEVFEIKPPKKEAKDLLSETDLVTFLPMEDLGILSKDFIGEKERQLKDVAGSYTYFANGDVLMAKITPCFENGKLGIARNLTNGIGFGSSEYIVFRSKGKIFSEYLYYFLARNQFREEGKQRMSGAVGHKRVSKDFIEECNISFPKSLSEQQTIVDKFDSISVETNKLKNIYQQKINDLDELKKSILQKAFNGELTASKRVSNVIEFPVRIPNISTTDLQAGIVGIAHQRHQEKGNVLTFGHVKAEKIVHLAESVLEIELDRQPLKDAAGPNDFPHLIKVQSRAEKAGFFYTNKQTYGGYSYAPGSQFDNLIEKTKTALNDKTPQLINLIDLLVPMDTQQAELVATVYAAWNNLLIDNQPITDEAIVTEARENWHEAKLNIPRERFFKTISWMNENNLIPKGKGKKVLVKR